MNKKIKTVNASTEQKRKTLKILKSNDHFQGPTKYIFLIKTFGCYLILCVNESYDIIKSFISEKCINVFNGKYIHKNQFEKQIIKHNPEIIYTNTGEIIKDIVSRFTVIVCENPINTREQLKKEYKKNNETNKEKYKPPSFEEIQKLDSTITYKEYKKIFE